ncbi:MAG TPA: MFS transporter [Dehalococcoidia bacterium]|nr:MFS transporter [Dehalococcoidia bacterium]
MADESQESNSRVDRNQPIRFAMFESLRFRDFRLIWLGQTSHALALWAQMIALPLLVLEITDNSAVQLGGVMAARTLPTLVLGVWAGVIVDWFDRRSILIATKWGAFLLAVLFAVLLIGGWMELWMVYAWVVARGSTQAFDQPARFSMVPTILPRHLITNGMALLSSTQNVMRIVGAAGAGLVAEFVGLTGTFILIAVIYSSGVVAIHMLHIADHARPSKSGLRAMTSGLAEGAKFAVKKPEIRGVLLISLVYFAFGMSYMQVFAPLFAVEVLDIGRGGLGMMLSITGVGALVAALYVANKQPTRLGLILPLDVTAFGVALILFTGSTYLPGTWGLAIPMALMLAIGALQTTFMSLSRSLMVQVAPDEMRGRILSFVSLDRSMMAFGGAAGGFLAGAYGVQITQIAFGIVCVAGGLLVLVLTPGFRAFNGQGVAQRRSHRPDEPAKIPSAESRSLSRPIPGPAGDGDS